MLQQKAAKDYVIATGKQHSVRDFVNAVAKLLDFDLRWEGEGLEEKARDGNGNIIVVVDPRYFRPTEVETLMGDASKAARELGWSPRTSFQELVEEMVAADRTAAERDALVKKHGFTAYNFHE